MKSFLHTPTAPRSLAIQSANGIVGGMRALVPCVVAAVLGFAAPAHADALRCGSRLVRDGDTRAEVRDLCGEPTDVQTTTILRRPHYDFNGRLLYYGDGVVEVPVEVWTYNFGPYKLMRRIRFVDGLIDDIETLGYGYHASASAARDVYR